MNLSFRLSRLDYTMLLLAGLTGIVAGNLTFLALTVPDHFLEPLRTPMMPGLYAIWRMAGSADGTVIPDGWVIPAAVFINAVVYAAAVMTPRLLWRHLSRPVERRSGKDRRVVSRRSLHQDGVYEDRRRLAA